MESGFSKWLLALMMVCGILNAAAQNQVKATALTHDVKDLSQRSSKIYDQNGERCALIRFETPIPSFFSFNLGAQQIEKRENNDDEVWIWVSADVKKMTIRCSECSPLKDYRVSLKAGNVYRAKLTTGLPQEIATTQKVNIYCEHAPFYISIDGAEPVLNNGKNYYTELPIGAHTMMVSAKLHKPHNSTIRVYRSRPYMDTIQLEDNYGLVRIQATQSDYQLYVDDELQAENRTIQLEPGQHKIVVKKDRYQSYEKILDVVLGGQHLLNAYLKPVFSQFSISAVEDDTEIWVDGKYIGINRANVELVWGQHNIEGRRQGYDTWEYPVKDFNESSELKIRIPKLNRQYGAIRLSVYPPEAMAYIDGKQVNIQNGVYIDPRMTTGTHYVQFRLTDYRSVRDSFVVESRKQLVRDYELEAIALGVASITTDSEIGIYRKSADDNEMIFLGHTSFQGKIPAGENIIELRNTAGVACQYHLFINEKQEHQVTFPFTRKLMIRKNVVGGEVQLKSGLAKPYRVKANKKMKTPPMKYEVIINKRGYQPFHDSIDMSDPASQSVIYRAQLYRNGDTIRREGYKSPAFLQRFYDTAGTWYIGIIDFGYTFDFNGGPTNGYKHIVTAGILPFRYRMLGVSPADFELSVTDSVIMQSLCYKPKISLVVPCSKGFAFTFYGGVSVNLHDALMNPDKPEIRTHLIGGVSMRFNYVGKFPMDIFGEYKWPLKGVDMSTIGAREQLFRVGVSFSVGVDH